MCEHELTQTEIEAMVRPIPGDFVVYWIVGEKMKVLYFTDTILSSFGISREIFTEATKNNALDVVMPNDRQYVLSTVAGKPVGDSVIHCRFRLMHREKGFFWVHAQSRIIGKMGGFSVVLTNYLNLSKESESFNRITDDSQTAFYTIDAHTYEILYANRTTRNWAKIEKGEIYAGHTCYEYMHLRQSPCPDCPLTRLEPEDLNCDERYDPLTGRWRSVTSKRVSWCGHDCMEMFIDDITEKKRKNDEEKANYMRYRLAVKGAKLNVWGYDIKNSRLILQKDEGTNDTRLLDFIPQIKENFPSSMMGMVLTDKDRAAFEKMFDKIRFGCEFVTAEIWFCIPGKIKPWCEQITYYVQKDGNGKPDTAYGVGRDVTEQKLEKAKFQNSMQALFASNPESLCSFQLNLTKDTCSEGHGISPNILKILRSDTVDGIYANTSKLIPTETERKNFTKKLNKKALLEIFYSGKNEYQYDYRRNGEAGNLIWVRNYVNMLRNPETGDIEAVSYSRDITREKRENEIFKLITNKEYDFVALLHLNTGKIEFMHISQSLPGEYRDYFKVQGQMYDFDDFKSIASAKWIDEADLGKYNNDGSVENIRRELDKNGHFEFIMLEHFSKDKKDLTCRKFQHYYLPGESDVALIIESDITDTYMKQQREAQRAKEEAQHIKDIIDSISSGVCVLQMPDCDHITGAFVNMQMFRLLGYDLTGKYKSRKDIENEPMIAGYLKDAFLAVHPDDRERIKKIFRDNYNSSYFDAGNYRLIRKDGSFIWINQEASLKEVTPQNKVFYATYRDVSEERKLHKELEAQIVEEKKLRIQATEASNAKTVFLSRISHDIRTPMNVIISKTNFAIEDTDKKDLLKKDLEDIKTSSNFLLSLINDILDLSKIESGTMELHPEAYGYEEYLSNMRGIFEPLCCQKGLRFRVVDNGASGVIYADKLRINQIALNLLSNAVKYTPKGGSVTLETGSIKLPDGKMNITIRVIDNGIGMSAEFQKRMFEPFTREAAPTSPLLTEQGTGLGLSIVKRITDIMGGTIKVVSTLGKGTDITVNFCCEEAACENTGENTDANTKKKKYYTNKLNGKDLVAEDYTINAGIAKRILTGFGLRVVHAENGAKAAAYFEKSAVGEYTAILMDIQMPVMNGYEATRKIRSLSRADAKTIPIIAMTADAYSEDVEKCMKTGMNGHVAKPIDSRLLRSMMYEICVKDANNEI